MAKLVLNMEAVQDDFFADTALLGIGSATAGHRFCWAVNQYLGYNFTRTPDADILYTKKKNEEPQNYAVYTCEIDHSGCRHVIYKVKTNNESLLPELKELDYLWLIQSQTAEQQARDIVSYLRVMPDVLLAQVLSADRLKSINHLLL